MRPIVQATVAASGAGSAVILNTYCETFMATVAVVLTTASLTYTVEYTVVPLNELSPAGGVVWTEANAPWFPLTGMTSLTANAAITIEGPVTAVRLNVTSYTSGTARFIVVQSGGIKN